MELVSCIITTYKREIDILERAALSVIHQTYKNIELIIINDYPDGRLNVERIEAAAKSAHRKFEYIVNKDPHGACNARNVGLDISAGNYVAFLDDDDEWLPQKIELQIEAFTNSKVGLVWCDSFMAVENKPQKRISRKMPIKAPSHFLGLLMHNYIGSTSFPLMRREAAIIAGKFDPLFLSSQDLDLWIRIARTYELSYVPKPLGIYYVGKATITSSTGNRKQGFEQTLEKYKGEYEKRPEIHIGKLNYMISIFMYYGEFKHAAIYLKKLIRKYGVKSVKIKLLIKQPLTCLRRVLIGF